MFLRFEFAAKTTKNLDSKSVTDWFVSDLPPEIKRSEQSRLSPKGHNTTINMQSTLKK
jgi:hypothetical protein